MVKSKAETEGTGKMDHAPSPDGVRGKPAKLQAHFEASGQAEDLRCFGDDEFDSSTNIIAGDGVPKDTAEVDRARVAREYKRSQDRDS